MNGSRSGFEAECVTTTAPKACPPSGRYSVPLSVASPLRKVLLSVTMTVDGAALHGSDVALRAVAGALTVDISSIATVQKAKPILRSVFLPGRAVRLSSASPRAARPETRVVGKGWVRRV